MSVQDGVQAARLFKRWIAHSPDKSLSNGKYWGNQLRYPLDRDLFGG